MDQWARCLYIRPRPLVRRPTRGQTDETVLGFLSKASGAAHGAGDGRSRVDVGRCEAQGGAPRPPPQHTGPRGPLGPCPAGSAPWMAMKALKPHRFGPRPGRRPWSAAAVPGQVGVLYAIPTQQKPAWVVTKPLGTPRGRVGNSGPL